MSDILKRIVPKHTAQFLVKEIMQLFPLIVFVLSVHVSAVRGNPVVLESSRFIELPVGSTLQLNCSSSSEYIIEFKEIGESLTIEDKIKYNIQQDGNPRVRYNQDGCLHNDFPNITTVTCVKTLEMDIAESLHGKSFQCRANTRHFPPDLYYSEGSYLHVRQPIPTHVLIATSVKHNEMSTATVEASPTNCGKITTTGVQSVVSPTSGVRCQCSGSVAAKYSLLPTLAAAAVVFIFNYKILL